MKGLRLYKHEKLCSATAIAAVFAAGSSVKSYPLRAVYRLTGSGAAGGGTPAKFLISVPKKKIRTAVGRVLMRRRVREAYRLNRHLLVPALRQGGVSMEIAFIYLDSRLLSYSVIEERMWRLLEKLAQAAVADASSQAPMHPQND